MITTLPVYLSFLVVFSSATSTPYEAQLLLDWAVNSTRNHGWDITVDPCFWAGITCGSNASGVWTEEAMDLVDGFTGMNGSVVGIEIDQIIQLGNTIYGEFPDLDLWANAKANNLAFTSLRYLTFIRFMFGPSFPATIENYWSNYNNTMEGYKQPFNVLLTSIYPFSLGNGAPAAVCTLPPAFVEAAKIENKKRPGRLDVGCSNFYIIVVSPDVGHMSGGNEVTITVSGPLAYLNIKVSFGSEDNLTEPVPITSLYFYDYPWHDYIYPLDPSQHGLNGTIFSQLTMITCISPPHPAGPVLLSVWAGSGHNAENPFQKVLPRVKFGYPYDKVFNYECPAGTKSDTINGTLTCIPCQSGEWSPIYSSTCFSCSMGSYSSQSSSSNCSLCPVGSYGNISGSASIDDCILCPPGSYNTEMGSTSCVACDPGMAQPNSGQTSCTSCRPGYYAYGYGNPYCIKCGTGSYSLVPQSTDCILCAIGQYAPGEGSTGCSVCLPGYTTSSLGMDTCDVTCQPGFYKSVGSDRCVACSPGRYTNGTGPFAICQICPIGEYNSYTNGTGCSKCPKGWTNHQGGSSGCIKMISPTPPPTQNNLGLIIGIVLLAVAIIFIIVAIIIVVYKKYRQKKKKDEIAEIQKIISGLGKDAFTA